MQSSFVNNLLDVQSAAHYLGMSKSWLDKARATGRGPRFIRTGTRVRYRKSDLDNYLEVCVRDTSDTRDKQQTVGSARW